MMILAFAGCDDDETFSASHPDEGGIFFGGGVNGRGDL
jgi:hypothetical protein